MPAVETKIIMGVTGCCLGRWFSFLSILMKIKELKITSKSILMLHTALKGVKRKKKYENSTANLRNNKNSSERKQNDIYPSRET